MQLPLMCVIVALKFFTIRPFIDVCHGGYHVHIIMVMNRHKNLANVATISRNVSVRLSIPVTDV